MSQLIQIGKTVLNAIKICLRQPQERQVLDPVPKVAQNLLEISLIKMTIEAEKGQDN